MTLENCAIGSDVAAACNGSGSVLYTCAFMHSLSESFSLFKDEAPVFGPINKNDPRSIPCTIPPTDIVIKFEQISRSIESRIKTSEVDWPNLIDLRRRLLHQLVSQICASHFVNPQKTA